MTSLIGSALTGAIVMTVSALLNRANASSTIKALSLGAVASVVSLLTAVPTLLSSINERNYFSRTSTELLRLHDGSRACLAERDCRIRDIQSTWPHSFAIGGTVSATGYEPPLPAELIAATQHGVFVGVTGGFDGPHYWIIYDNLVGRFIPLTPHSP